MRKFRITYFTTVIVGLITINVYNRYLLRKYPELKVGA